MTPWNVIRGLWYSWGRQVFAIVALLMGFGAAATGIVLMSLKNWTEAASAMSVAAPFIAVSLGNLFLALEQPETSLHTSEESIKKFMRKFIAQGSRVHIGSYSLSWVRGDPEMQSFLKEQAGKGKDLTIFVNEERGTSDLVSAGIHIKTYTSPCGEAPRFTLLNLGREGAERLAVAREGLPTHWIDVYTDKRHPQVIALAKAYVARLESGE